MANFRANSRYTNGIVTTNRSNKNFLILRKPLQLEPDSSDSFIFISTELEKRPDLVSFKCYGVVELWWAIYEFNNIRDPLFDIKAGQILRIPAIERVLDAIQKLGK